jgi:hypothetical protein
MIMKKIVILTFVTILSLVTSSCSNSDDSSSSNSELSLTGTAWLGTADDEGEVYNFTSSTEFIFSGEGVTNAGTYTFNGANGVFIGENYSFDFSISNNVMTVDNGDMSTYIKQ